MIEILNKNDNLVELIQYISEVNNDFEIPISDKTDIAQYAAKLIEFGNILAYRSNGEILGIVGFYSNDKVGFISYISILSVLKRFRSHGCAHDLLNAAFQYCINKQMKKCRLQSTNPKAVSIYEGLGFNIYKQELLPQGFTRFFMEKIF